MSVSVQARRGGPLTAPAVLSYLALLVTAAAALDVALRGFTMPLAAAAFGVTIAFGEAIRIDLPRGRDSAPLASSAALGFVLCYSIGGRDAVYAAGEAVVVIALATACGVAVQAYAGRQARPGYLAQRVLVAGFAALVFRGWLKPGPASGLFAGHSVRLGTLLVAVAAATVVLDHSLSTLLAANEPPVRALGRGVGTGAAAEPSRWEPAGPAARPRLSAGRLLTGFRDECMAAAWVCPTVILFAVAIATAAAPLGLWVLPITAAPILVVQRSLRRYAEISATYQQTIRALSRVTELADYTEPGHARRVCHLALAVGRDLSLPESLLADLEYAALLHDIGQLSLTDPIPRGATVLISPERAGSIAALGADVVRQTGVLDRVADILEQQCRPYHPERADEPVALAGAIVRAANAYDDLAGATPDADRRRNALSRIRLGEATEYDPRVVESLVRIVESVDPSAV